MSIPTKTLRLALSALAFAAATTAAVEAKPKRIAIMDFDGPRTLADNGRSSVMSILSDEYEVVPAKRWDDAKRDASRRAHGPEQWARAAKSSGIGAVVEGMVQEEGRRKILAITVREADNGKEFDTIEVRLDGKGNLSSSAQKQLQSDLDKLLFWIDTGRNEAAPAYAPVAKDGLGSSRAVADDTAEVTVRPAPGTARRHVVIEDDQAAEQEPPKRTKRVQVQTEDQDETPAPAKRVAKTEAPAEETEAPAHDAKPAEVATATDPEVHNLNVLFPPDAVEQTELNPKAHHVPQASPRIAVDAGLYMGSRSLSFQGDDDSNLQQFNGVSSKGFQVNVQAYPFPIKKTDGGLTGIGFTGSMHHSVASTVDFDDTDQVDSYVLNQNGWELGVHYRQPINDLVTLDGGAFYGNQTYQILDASQDFEIPDTKYSYLGASAHLDLNITDRATVGFGARYFTVLDTGDLSSTDWFGPTSASGLGLEASFMIPLPASLYVRGQIAYQHISMEMSGGGVITDDENVTAGSDSTIIGNVNLGIAF